MRIISGRYRGLKLACSEGENIRPTADRVKESLFNILSDKVSGAKVLDLFCGSGNLGIECLSRGAESVHFNDLSKDSIAVLKKNLAKIRDENFTVSNSDFRVCLSRGAKYDLIFIDPPYKENFGTEAVEIIAKGNNLTENGVIVFERDVPFEKEVDGISVYDRRKYGKTHLTFMERTK